MDSTPLTRQNEPDWHGWRAGTNASLHIGRLPGRKQVCLYVEDGSVIRTLAFFKTEQLALQALELLDGIAHARGVA